MKVGSARFFYCLFSWLLFLGAGEEELICIEKSIGTGGLLLEAADRLLVAIQKFAEPLLASMELELVEVQFRREGHGWVLRFFIDKEGGVSIDDCANASREISAYLEVEDLIDHAYHLEVSSPGLERPLKKKEDFVRFAGRLARIKLQEPLDGQRVLIGNLCGLEGECLMMELEGKKVFLDMSNIVRARLTL